MSEKIVAKQKGKQTVRLGYISVVEFTFYCVLCTRYNSLLWGMHTEERKTGIGWERDNGSTVPPWTNIHILKCEKKIFVWPNEKWQKQANTIRASRPSEIMFCAQAHNGFRSVTVWRFKPRFGGEYTARTPVYASTNSECVCVWVTQLKGIKFTIAARKRLSNVVNQVLPKRYTIRIIIIIMVVATIILRPQQRTSVCMWRFRLTHNHEEMEICLGNSIVRLCVLTFRIIISTFDIFSAYALLQPVLQMRSFNIQKSSIGCICRHQVWFRSRPPRSNIRQFNSRTILYRFLANSKKRESKRKKEKRQTSRTHSVEV